MEGTTLVEDDTAIAALEEAASLALKVALESLNCLTAMNDTPDEISFRWSELQL